MVNFRRYAQAFPVEDPATGPEGAGEVPDVPALSDPPPCPYCGSRDISETNETGRGNQYICGACGGAQSTSGDNVATPELIGDPSNHPKGNADPDTGGVGGAGNLPQSPKVVHDRPGERRMQSWEASRHVAVAEDHTHDLIPVKKAGFVGHVEAYHGAEDAIKDMEKHVDGPDHPSHPHHFNHDLFDSVQPEPTDEEKEHQKYEGELPESYHERHDFAYQDAKDKLDQERHSRADDEVPVGHHTALTNFIIQHHDNHDLWKNHAQIEHVDTRTTPIYATQPHVTREHLQRYIDNPNDQTHAMHIGEGDPGNVANHYPQFVRHEGNLFACEGHHRTGSAIHRGVTLPVAMYDADKNGFPDAAPHENNYEVTHPGLTRTAARNCAYSFDDEHDHAMHALRNHDDGICVATEVRKMKGTRTPHEGSIDVEASWHFCATWADVRNKARDITRTGGVHIAVSSGDGIGGEVQGEHNVYETYLAYVPGTKKVGYWHCGCKWGTWAWGRSPAYKRFEGRMCSHALAMQFEAQRQHGFGRKPHAQEQPQRPEWLRPNETRVVVHHQRAGDDTPAIDHARFASATDPEGVYPSGHALDLVNTPLHAVAADLVSRGTDPGQMMRTLLAFGAAHEPAQRLVRQAINNPELLPTDGTSDAREHAEDRGVGVPEPDGELAECQQCHGKGCGACGGVGQVKDGQSTIPDQNADAGMYSRGMDSVTSSLTVMSADEYNAIVRTGDYASHDAFPYSAPEVRNPSTSPEHSNSHNPGSTGPMTAQDPHDWDDAWDHRDDLGGQHYSSKSAPEPDDEPDPPSHAGVALKAHDTGNVLFLQRAHPHNNPDDPAAGKWEFPGGGLEPGDQTTLHGAIREFEEETGHPFPAGGTVHHTWRSGPYQGHVVVIPEQDALDPRAPRKVENPDGDNEAMAWQNPRYMRNRADTRDEVKHGTPWGKIENARLEKAAGRFSDLFRTTDLSEPAGGAPSPWEHHTPTPASDDAYARGCEVCGSKDIVAYDNHKGHAYCRPHIEEKQASDHPIAEQYPERAAIGEPQATRLRPISASLGELNDQPEPALPTTTGEDSGDEENWGPPQNAKGHIPVGGNGASSYGERFRSEMAPGIPGDQIGGQPNQVHASADPELAVADIVARFQTSAAAKALSGGSGATGGRDGGISDSDIALAAKTALKQFSPSEQAELINEKAASGRARNYGDLNITGTHYEEIPEDTEELVL